MYYVTSVQIRTMMIEVSSEQSISQFYIYKALRSAGGTRHPLRLLQEGKKKMLCEAGKGPWSIVGANWRLEDAKSLAAMFQENNPDATRMSIPRMYLVSCCICVYLVCICLSRSL